MIDGFDEAIEAIYSAAFGGGAWRSALDRCCEVIGSNGLIVNPVRFDRPGMLLFSDNLTSAVQDYERHWRHRDLRIGAILGSAAAVAGKVVTERVIGITARDRAKDAFYQEFLRPLDMECFAAYLYQTADGPLYSISAQRERGRDGFEAAEQSALARLGRHLVRAIDLAPRAAWAVAHAGSLAAGFDRLGHGLLSIDRAGRVEPLNRMAERLMLGGFDGIPRSAHGRIRPLGDPIFERFVAAVLGRLAGGPMVEPVVIARPSGMRLLLQMLPAAPTEPGDTPTAERSAAVISIYDVGALRSTAVTDLLCGSGLTPGEARVAATVGSGRTPREAAIELGLTEMTVRGVLKTVYGKLGLRRQSELGILVSGLRSVRIGDG